jgi:hypothetical protein
VFIILPKFGRTQFSYQFSVPKYMSGALSENSFSNKSGDYILSLQSFSNGCAQISWGTFWDTIINIRAKQAYFFELPGQTADTTLEGKREGPGFPALQIQSQAPLSVQVFANLKNRFVLFNRVNQGLCNKVPSEAYSIGRLNAKGSTYKFTNVHSLSYNQELITDSLKADTPIELVKRFLKRTMVLFNS